MKNVLVITCSCFLIIISWNTVGADLTELQTRGKKLVTGGQNAALGETPYQVFLQEEGMKFCGGIILTKYEILTAAHCFDGKVHIDGTVDDIEVVAGELKLQTPPGNRTAEVPQKREVHNVIPHTGYRKEMQVNDLAIARLSQPFEFNTYIRNANLSKADAPYPIGKAKASGWGPMGEDQLLNIVELQLLSQEDCAEILNKWLDLKDWNDKLLCAEYRVYDGRIRKGYSGGPLYKDGEVIGIVTQGEKERNLALFTRVSQYMDWILGTSGHLKDEL